MYMAQNAYMRLSMCVMYRIKHFGVMLYLVAAVNTLVISVKRNCIFCTDRTVIRSCYMIQKIISPSSGEFFTQRGIMPSTYVIGTIT
jgi:hypothetical protein